MYFNVLFLYIYSTWLTLPILFAQSTVEDEKEAAEGEKPQAQQHQLPRQATNVIESRLCFRLFEVLVVHFHCRRGCEFEVQLLHFIVEQGDIFLMTG